MFQYTIAIPRIALMLMGFALLPASPTQAQLSRGQCTCETLPPTESGYFINQQKAIEQVDNLLADIRKYTRVRFDGAIQVKETDCPVPRALLCEVRRKGRLIQERLIIYNNDYLNRITQKDAPLTWVDRHVLAHEIGHHVLGHLGENRSLVPLEQVYERETTEKRRHLPKRALGSLQARELEADFFGLWLLARTTDRFPFAAFINSFDTTYVRAMGSVATPTAYSPVPDRRSRSKSLRAESATHPFFSDRLLAMQDFWERLKTERRTVGSASYFASEANAAYIKLNPDRTFYDVALVAGLTVAGRPVFRFDGMPVDALLYPPSNARNFYIGLALSRFNWQNAFRIEGEVAWSQQQYGTTVGKGTNQRLLETLDLRYLTVFPKLTWSPLARDGHGRSSIRRLGFFTSVGPSVRVPLGFAYQNYAVQVDPANQPTLQPSVSPRLSVGIELLKKTFLPRGYKLALNYEFQRIRLNATPRPATLSHNLDATLYYTFIRR